MDLIEAMILAVPCCLNHGLVRPCMTLQGNQGIQRPVDADQRFANYAIVRECINGFPHALGAVLVVIVCKPGVRKGAFIIWIKFADIQTLGNFP